jgi:ATP synthase F1 gamma subunit
MPTTLQTINEQAQQLEELRGIVETYESVAALYIRRSKKSVVNARLYYDGLRGIYAEILEAHRADLADMPKPRSLVERIAQTVAKRNKREAALLLSVNTGLYGDIVQHTLNAFVHYVSSHKTDIVIAGKRGALLFEKRMPNAPYQFLPLADSIISAEDIITASAFLAHYQHVRIFHGKFQSLITQIPAETALGRESAPIEKPRISKSAEMPVLYLFEPSLSEIVTFFKNEIFNSLVQQTMQESHLAKLGSRLNLLDKATDRVHTTLGSVKLLQQKYIHREKNKKQMETVTSRIALGI